ncbi:MAG: phosphatase PAP2-related protein [Candidatus Paceibacterota bacterium]
MIRDLIAKHKNQWTQKEFINSTAFGAIFLITSFFINYGASVFATRKASNGVADLILDNIPVMNVGDLFVYGGVTIFIFGFIVLLCEPKYFPFTLKSIALFILIRSIFITLTHIGLYPELAPLPDSRLIGKVFFGGDLFFSGHTGMPFLMALIFWKQFRLRITFIAISIIFGILVLLGHYHYSIDVAAAFFITYSIFEISKKLFPKSYKLISE